MKLRMEQITIEFQPITGSPVAVDRQLDISLYNDSGVFVDNVVIDKSDILWLLQEIPDET